MYYHIGRCMAPCCAKISAEEYATHVRRVEQLLAGSSGSARGTDGTSGTNGEGNNGTSDNGTDAAETLILDLTAEMHKAAKDLNFERAAQLRNAIRAIEDLAGGDSSVVDFDPEGRDYIAWATEGIFTTFTVFSMRGGKMTGRELFRTRSAADEYESLETFAASYYNPGRIPPAFIFITQPHKESLTDEIEDAPPSVSLAPSSMPIAPPSISFAPSDVNSLSRWFKEQFGFEPEISVPAERHHTAVLAMAHQNAVEDLRKRLKERGAGPALDELVQALSLSRRPERIEGFDIAQLDGKHPVASLISFKNGVPDRKNYRYFKLRSVVGIVDDFAAMREVVHRRYSRLIREGKELPDLVLIDGGIGQVNAAKGVMDELGMHSDVAGLAKRDEELWLPHAREPVRLSKRSEGLKVLQFVRDETHRFATGFNQRLRSGDLFFPVLESVEGIGPKRAAAIMKIYENIGNIAAASPEELAEKCRISEGAARAVRAAAKLALEDQAAAKKRLNPAAGTTRRGAGGGKWAGERRGGNDGSERNGDSWRAAKTESLAEAALSDAFAAEAEAEYGEESGTDGK
jgi:excinuclease ABC subunit C